jgi:hypothetical protein
MYCNLCVIAQICTDGAGAVEHRPRRNYSEDRTWQFESVVYAHRGCFGVRRVTDLLPLCTQILEEAGFGTAIVATNSQRIIFENDTVLGFVSIYEGVQALASAWQSDLDKLVRLISSRYASLETRRGTFRLF